MRRYNQAKSAFLSATFAAHWGSYHSYRGSSTGVAIVVFVSMSEFGRTTHENGNHGTDHGHANCMFVMGGDVKGGRVYSRWPGIGDGQRTTGAILR
jgi:uncharacterized protein (DUF1501 family)